MVVEGREKAAFELEGSSKPQRICTINKLLVGLWRCMDALSPGAFDCVHKRVKPDNGAVGISQWVRTAGSKALSFALFGEPGKATPSPCAPPPQSVKYGFNNNLADKSLRGFTNNRDNKICVKFKCHSNAKLYEPGLPGQSVSLLISFKTCSWVYYLFHNARETVAQLKYF